MNLFHLNFPYDCFVCPSMGKCAIRNIRITGTGAHQFSDAMILRIQLPLKDICVVLLLCPCHSARIKMWIDNTFLLVWLCSSQMIMGRPMLPCVTQNSNKSYASAQSNRTVVRFFWCSENSEITK